MATVVERDEVLELAQDAEAATLGALGCRYQQARSLVLAGGEARSAGEALLSAIGAAPMALPAPATG